MIQAEKKLKHCLRQASYLFTILKFLYFSLEQGRRNSEGESALAIKIKTSQNF